MDNNLKQFMQRRATADSGETAVDPAEVKLDVEGEAAPVAPDAVQLPFGSNTANRLIRPEGTRPCPICDVAMETFQEFGVMFDVCAEHGVWLDKGELETLADLRTRASRDAMRATIAELRSQPRGGRGNLFDVAESFFRAAFGKKR